MLARYAAVAGAMSRARPDQSDFLGGEVCGSRTANYGAQRGAGVPRAFLAGWETPRMSLQNESSTLTTFRARPLVPATMPRRNTLTITPRARMPRFPVSGQREKTSWFSLLGTLFERVHFPTFREPVRLFRQTPLLPFRMAGRSLSLSGVLHV